MKDVFESLLKQVKAGAAAMLVSVAESEGSSPREAGAIMAVGAGGRLAGTIGGGNLEFNAEKTAVKDIAEKNTELVEYRLTKEEVAGLGMVCGGDVDVLYTYLPADEKTKAALECITEQLSGGGSGWLVLGLDGGIGFISGKKGAVSNFDMPDFIDLTQAGDGVIEKCGRKFYIKKIAKKSCVYVFGGGHLAQETVPLLTHLDFDCVVTDDREEYSSKELFPEAKAVYTLNYTDLKGNFDITDNDYIVIVTRGHMGDYDAEKYALSTPACYIGVVGSRSKIAEVNAKLASDGFTKEDIARVTTPIGIDIKSETPAEIAVSIAAQLIEKRASLRNRQS